ncbi:hypothetical protein KXD97_10065 [Mycobacterium sp. SMC-8]|uniref:hypothetical protein n=1 Tax=Mycobacterium sp. SMC-8 TaxID=2857060 RepID=UPI0021B28BBA|nr:hypothetical protein [Mycobacterium sp. SMC-8]UXA14087.1 hypothetical protein KXD97_10065 [Mycobacterium sp. SMC-8]
MNARRDSWLSKLKAKYPRIDADADGGGQPSIGSICRAEPMDRSADNVLVLVVDSDPRSYSFTVVLLTPDVELATDKDVYLSVEATGLPYALAAQTDVFGYVWNVQLKTIGSLPGEMVRELFSRNPPMDTIPDEFKAGPPLDSPSDPRWANKIAELDRLNAVTGDCTRQLIEGEQDLIVDPVSFRLDPVGLSDFDLVDFVLDVVTMVERGEVSMPAWLMRGIMSDRELEESYRRWGLLDLYSTLTQVLNQKLWSIDDEPDAPDFAAVDRPGLELLQAQVLLDSAASGTTFVKFVGRSRDAISYPQRRTVGRRMFQCVLVPCHS